jgi:carboxylesterase type B
MANPKLLLSRLKAKEVDSYINSLRFPGVKIKKDITYCDEGMKLDLFLPKEKQGKIPVFVNFHGGFFLYGNKKRRHGYCSYLCDRGFAVVNVGYGLAPQYAFPEQARQGSLALKWIEEKADKYGFDLTKVAVGGDGIGAYLACQVIAANSNPEYREKIDTVGVNFSIRSAVFFRGIFDMHLVISVSSYSRKTQDLVLRQIMGSSDPDMKNSTRFELISPIRYIDDKFPDTFFAYDKQEITRAEQGARLKNILNRYGIPNWEFRSIYNRFVRAGQDEASHPNEVMQCMEVSADFLEKTFFGTIETDELYEI